MLGINFATTPSDYVIEWRMNSTSGNVIFTTAHDMNMIPQFKENTHL